MIIFEFNDDSSENREVWWLGGTTVTGVDKPHVDEIYEQLDAELAFNL